MTPEEFTQATDALFASVPEMAEALGMSRSCVDHWRSGRRPVPESIVKLLDCIAIVRASRKGRAKP